ncbi:MAG: serine O-acetyltransferase [Actinobacteria bacterium]|uniref:Serine acetyltransferase n=1 Tax=freshwater metagenome TaxID=449393 RepID=A0A6J7GZT7_9ZZZZ|nr:serine O-acetyltransferase [Actinomycetota bacterium]
MSFLPQGLVSFIAQAKEDVASVLERDPAARSALEVALLYPGVHAVWAHRVSNSLWNAGAYLPARSVSQAARAMTGVEIHPAATIGPRVFIDHGAGVVIGETSIIGADVTIYHGVTLGGTSLNHGKRHPTVGDRVTIGAGAKILGDIEVGSDSRIGANAVLVRSVDPDSVVVGVPGQVVARAGVHTDRPRHDAQDRNAPDPVGSAVHALLARVEKLETQVTGKASPEGIYRPVDGVWEVTDFSI